MRERAGLVAVEFAREDARGAAVDHLGSLLLLWSVTAERAPAVASEIVRAHLDRARTPLRNLATARDSYGCVAAASLMLVEVLLRSEAGEPIQD